MGLVSLIVLFCIAAAGVGLVEIVIRRSDIGAGLVLMVIVIQQAAPADLVVVPVGPVNIFPNDLLVLVLGTCAIARLLRADRSTAAQRLLIGLAGLAAWSVFRGIEASGFPATINDGRKYLVFIAVALYFSTIEPRQDLFERIGRMWLLATAALCCLTLVRWGANAVGVTGGLFGPGWDLRVIPAEATLIIGQASLMVLVWLRASDGGLRRYVTPALIVFVLLLQHRTVWVVVAAGLLVLLIRERALTLRLTSALTAGLLVFAVLTFTLLDDDANPVGDQLAASATETGTFTWRVSGWQALFRDSGPDGIGEVATGKPFASGWLRRFNGVVVDVSPHNFYVETFLRIGAIGLVSILWLYAIALIRRRSKDSPRAVVNGLLSPNVLTTCIFMQLLYFITYTPHPEQAMLLGMGCAMTAAGGSDRPLGLEPTATKALR